MRFIIVLLFALSSSRAVAQDLYYNVSATETIIKVVLFANTAPIIENTNRLDTRRVRLTIIGSEAILIPDEIVDRYSLGVTSVNIEGNIRTHIVCACEISIYEYANNFYVIQLSTHQSLTATENLTEPDDSSNAFLYWWRYDDQSNYSSRFPLQFQIPYFLQSFENFEGRKYRTTSLKTAQQSATTSATLRGIQIRTQDGLSRIAECFDEHIFIMSDQVLDRQKYLNVGSIQNNEADLENSTFQSLGPVWANYLSYGLLVEARSLQDELTASSAAANRNPDMLQFGNITIEGFCRQSDILKIVSGREFSIPLSSRDTVLLQFKALHRNLQLTLIDSILKKFSNSQHYYELREYAKNTNLLSSSNSDYNPVLDQLSQRNNIVLTPETISTEPQDIENPETLRQSALSLEAFRIEHRGTDAWNEILKEEIEFHIAAGDYHIAQDKIELLAETSAQKYAISEIYAMLASAMRDSSNQADILGIMVSEGYSNWPTVAQSILGGNLSGLDIVQAQTQLDGQIKPRLQSNLHFWGTQASRAPQSSTSASLTRDQIVSALNSAVDLRTLVTDTLQP